MGQRDPLRLIQVRVSASIYEKLADMKEAAYEPSLSALCRRILVEHVRRIEQG